MKPMSMSCYRLRRCFATFAYDDPAILKFLVFDPCRAPGSSGAPRKAIGPVSCCSQLPMKAILQGKSNMRLSARVAYLHFVLVRRVFKMQRSMSEILSPNKNDNVFAQDTFLKCGHNVVIGCLCATTYPDWYATVLKLYPLQNGLQTQNHTQKLGFAR